MSTFPTDLTPADGGHLELTDVHVGRHRVRVAFSGEIDMSTAPAFTGTLVDAIREHPSAWIEVDLAGIRFLDSSGVKALIDCHRCAHQQLSVVDPQPVPRRVLEITGVLECLLGRPTDHRFHGRGPAHPNDSTSSTRRHAARVPGGSAYATRNGSTAR